MIHSNAKLNMFIIFFIKTIISDTSFLFSFADSHKEFGGLALDVILNTILHIVGNKKQANNKQYAVQ